MRAPPINYGPVGFATTCTVSVPTYSRDSAGRPTVSTSAATTNVPCTIQASGASEAMRFGDGRVNESTTTWVGYFPSRKADGTALAIPASAVIVADGVTYEVKGAAQEYADGLQRAPLEVKA